MDISNIRVTGHTEKISVECPDCAHKNTYFVHPACKFEAIRHCFNCGAVMIFLCEEEANNATYNTE